MGTVRIGCIDYAIIMSDSLVDEEGNEIFGQCAYDTCEIQILSRLAAQTKLATLWHEIVHAILIDCGYADHDEQMVSALAHGILSVLKNNPKIEVENLEDS